MLAQHCKAGSLTEASDDTAPACQAWTRQLRCTLRHTVMQSEARVEARNSKSPCLLDDPPQPSNPTTVSVNGTCSSTPSGRDHNSGGTRLASSEINPLSCGQTWPITGDVVPSVYYVTCPEWKILIDERDCVDQWKHVAGSQGDIPERQRV